MIHIYTSMRQMQVTRFQCNGRQLASNGPVMARLFNRAVSAWRICWHPSHCNAEPASGQTVANAGKQAESDHQCTINHTRIKIRTSTAHRWRGLACTHESINGHDVAKIVPHILVSLILAQLFGAQRHHQHMYPLYGCGARQCT